MAVTIPIDLIDASDRRWTCTRFELAQAQNVGQSGGGDMPVVTIGNPVWVASYTWGPARVTDFDRMKALIHALRGATNPFLAWDCSRRRPIYYATGGADPGGWTGRLVDVTGGLRRVTIDQVPAAFRVRAGDYCRITMNGKRYYYQFLEDANAGSPPAVTAVEVQPDLPADWELNATVYFDKPQCLMKIVPGSLQMARQTNGFGSISFDAVQVLPEAS